MLPEVKWLPWSCYVWIVVLIIGADSNDDDRPLRFAVLEELPAGSEVGTIRPRNIDDVQRNLVEFTVRRSSPHGRYFDVDRRTGRLYTSAVLDREVLCPHRPPVCTLTLDVVVGPRRFFDIIRVVVDVADVNDHAPAFPRRSTAATLTQCGGATTVRLPAADDADAGPPPTYRVENSPVAASLEVVRLFDGSHDLRLQLDGADVARRRSVTVQIVASDDGDPPLTDTLLVHLVAACVDEVSSSTIHTTSGADDAGLSFENATYHVTIPKSTPIGTIVLRVHAVVRRHLDDVITYGISNRSAMATMFAIDRRTGELSLRGHLVPRRAAVARLTVTAGSASSLPVYADVIVHVGEGERTAVMVLCDTCRYVVAVSEDAPPKTLVAVMLASSRLPGTCSLANSSLFELRRAADDDATYSLVTTSTLDREVHSGHQLSVRCRRSTSSVQSTTKSVIDVSVLDVNDNRPEVVSDTPLEVTVSENIDVGVVLATVTALDRDAGENSTMRFSVRHCTPADVTSLNVTSVNSTSAVVTAGTVFNHDRSLHECFMSVCDSGAVTSLCADDVIVRVHVVAARRPRFSKPGGYQFTVPENQPAGTLIGRVKARYKDSRPLVYSLRDDAEGEFEVDSVGGDVHTRRPLDHESRPVFLLDVCVFVEDSSSIFDCVNVTVHVLDVNDNRPVVQQRQRVTVSRGAAVGSVVTHIIATDADSGLNSRLVYSVVAGDDDDDRAFHVDRLTGIITLTVPGHALDHARYQLDVLVSDTGRPPLKSSVRLTVDVTSSSMTSRVGGVSLLLVVVVVAIVVVVSLVAAIVIVVACDRCRRAADVKRPPTTTAKAATTAAHWPTDDEALTSLLTHLSRSVAARSRDFTHSAATINAVRNNDSSSTCLGSLDCSVVSAPATCQCSSLIGRRPCVTSHRRDVRRMRSRSCCHGDIPVAAVGHCCCQRLNYTQPAIHQPQLLAGTSDEDNTMSEYSGECTDSGRGHSAAGLSS